MFALKLYNYSIKTRLWVMLSISVTCILFVLGGSLFRTYVNVSEVRELMVKQQTATATSLLEYFYQQEQNGVLSREEAQDQAKNAVKKLRYRDVEYFWINDTHPKMIMHPIQTNLDKQDLSGITDPTGLHLFVRFVEVSTAQPDGDWVPYLWPKVGSKNPVPKVSYVRLFEPWGWIVGTGVYTDDIKHEFIGKAKELLIVTGLLLILMIVLNVFVVRSIRLPLNKFTDAMHNISRGDGDLSQRLPVKGKDELADIGRSFNHFVGHIHSVIQETQSTVRFMQELSNKVVLSCERTTGLTRDQLQETDQSATASNEMSLTIKEVAENAEKAAEAAREADANAQRGLNIMNSTQDSILALAKSIQHSSQNIDELREQTNEIGTVLNVIQEIAEQTNLLALNAAIEAARAGEAGRGFAVVADEVRNLASRSHQSTEEINQIISKLQSKAQQAVNAMQDNVHNSESTAASAAQAMEAIAAINQAASTITEMNLSIASAVEEQSVAANEISNNIVLIADASNQVSSTMLETTTSVSQLQNNTSTLNALVERFKL